MKVSKAIVDKTIQDNHFDFLMKHSADDMEKDRKSIVSQKPAANHAIALADISGMMSVCLRDNDYSRINI
jgi:hypothetical protein